MSWAETINILESISRMKDEMGRHEMNKYFWKEWNRRKDRERIFQEGLEFAKKELTQDCLDFSAEMRKEEDE